MNQDINVLALVKGAERYVFLYDDSSRAETLRVLGRYASNPELSFTWYDAAVLSQKIRQESRKATIGATLRHAAPQRRRRRGVLTAGNVRRLGCWRRRLTADRDADLMQTAVTRFLQYLRVERNASALTIKSYREDLAALVEYLTELAGQRAAARRRSPRVDLRGYVAALHEAGYAKTTIARRLASLRSFFRFGQREGWTKSTRPSRCAIRASRARCRIFSRPTTSSGCCQRPAGTSRWACATGRFWKCCIRPACASANWPASTTSRSRFRRAARCASAARDAASGIAPIGSFADARPCKHWLAVRNCLAAKRAAARGARLRQQVRPPADDAQRRPHAGKASASRPASTGARRRTRCGTALPRICSTAAPTFAACRNCWATRAWSRRRSTRTSARRACEPPTSAPPAGQLTRVIAGSHPAITQRVECFGTL